MGLEFLAALQRPQPAQPRQQGRAQRPARQQVRTQRQARQQARRQVSRCKDRPLPTPQKTEEHIRVRLRPRAQRQSGRVKQLLRPLTAEVGLHHQKSGRRVRNKSSSRRQVVATTPSAARPERNLKLAERQLKERPRARKQRDQLERSHEVAKARVHRNDHKNNQFGLTVSVHYSKSARHISAGLFCTQNGNYVVLLSTAAVSAARYFTPRSQTKPERKMIPDTNRNATCIFV